MFLCKIHLHRHGECLQCFEKLTRQPPQHPHHKQWVTYTLECVMGGLKYFKNQCMTNLKPAHGIQMLQTSLPSQNKGNKPYCSISGSRPGFYSFLRCQRAIWFKGRASRLPFEGGRPGRSVWSTGVVENKGNYNTMLVSSGKAYFTGAAILCSCWASFFDSQVHFWRSAGQLSEGLCRVTTDATV